MKIFFSPELGIGDIGQAAAYVAYAADGVAAAVAVAAAAAADARRYTAVQLPWTKQNCNRPTTIVFFFQKVFLSIYLSYYK